MLCGLCISLVAHVYVREHQRERADRSTTHANSRRPISVRAAHQRINAAKVAANLLDDANSTLRSLLCTVQKYFQAGLGPKQESELLLENIFSVSAHLAV